MAGKISVVEIGDVTLRDVGCNMDLYDLLDPGRDAILYVHNHFFRKRVIIGVKYPDTGKVYMMRFGTLVASALAYVLIYPLLAVAAGFMIGMMGGKDGRFMGTLGILVMLGAFAYCVYTAAMLVRNYMRWRTQ